VLEKGQTMPPSCRLIHWNIRELDSRKFDHPDPQVIAAAHLVARWQPQLLSINELHYDSARTLGDSNAERFLRLAFDHATDWHLHFTEPNTGSRAVRDEQGRYLTSRPAEDDLVQWQRVDQTNFGFFPGQYGCGLASRFPITDKQAIRELSWLDWEPGTPLASYDWGGAHPEHIPLFDKSLQISRLAYPGGDIAMITLHAVPAFHFGNDRSPNLERNAAQLRFLEWLLLGTIEPDSPSPVRRGERGVQPLPPELPFIAVGDLNVALDSSDPGAAVVKRMLQHPRLHNRVASIPGTALSGLKSIRPHHTYFHSGWKIESGIKQLDYALVSRSLKIHRLETIFYHPQFRDHGSYLHASTANYVLSSLPAEADRVYTCVGYQLNEGTEAYRIVSAHKDFAELRLGSDHLPLLLEFS
jgi:endonuclease/exonuclease/phosphatase family metal-dependent hydrolase